MRPLATAAVGAILGALIPGNARATPQVGSALTVGGGVVGLEREDTRRAAVHLGGRVDALFLRERDGEMAIGPYLEVASEAFRSFEVGAGVDWLLALTETFPLVLSAGGALRSYSGLGWEPGLCGAAFFGSRGYNFHSWYGLTGGLFIQGRRSLGASHDSDIIAGVELDLTVFAYPVLFLAGALRQ